VACDQEEKGLAVDCGPAPALFRKVREKDGAPRVRFIGYLESQGDPPRLV